MIITEDGTGELDANSYVSQVEADAFTEARGLENLSPELLIRATDLLDTLYVYRSVRLTDEQSLEYPRYPHARIPPKLKTATIQLALELRNEEAAVRGIAEKTVKVGSVETTTKYDPVTSSTSQDPYPRITILLRSLANRAGSTVQIGRGRL